MLNLLKLFAYGLATTCALITFAGCGAAREGSSDSSSGGPLQAQSQPPSPDEEALLAEITRGISADVTVRFVDVPTDLVEPGEPAKSAPAGAWLEVDLPGQSPGTDESDPATVVHGLRSRWDGSLILGAYRDAAAAQGLQLVIGASFLADGVVTDRGLLSFETGSREWPPGQSHPVAVDEATIRASVEKGAAAGSMAVGEIQFVSGGLAPAPVIELTASTPHSVLEDRAWLPELLGQGRFSLEGWFVVIRDRDGVPFYVSAVATRAGGGSVWVRPDLIEAFQRGGGLGPAGVLTEPGSGE